METEEITQKVKTQSIIQLDCSFSLQPIDIKVYKKNFKREYHFLFSRTKKRKNTKIWLKVSEQINSKLKTSECNIPMKKSIAVNMSKTRLAQPSRKSVK